MDSDEDIQLRADTFAALQDFYNDQKKQEELESDCVALTQNKVLAHQENWQLSQFWYDENTGIRLAKEAIRVANGGAIACLSCPSVFQALLSLKPPNAFYVFEIDNRFDCYGDQFVYYDFNRPESVPEPLQHHCSVIIIDPPFLNEETLSLYKKTCTLLKKTEETPLIVCSAETVEFYVKELFEAKPNIWRPVHSNRLSNPFYCYTNFESQTLGGWVNTK
eukprot:GCRY01001796.1.p1 GENE.GCRY01001796.1~~GCRY01001796.1.p1  ORF type:complete len:220 (-),score=8.73 GCRY01001796.1:463-1122(-)